MLSKIDAVTFGLLALVFAAIFGGYGRAATPGVCPPRAGDLLKYIDVFDGKPAELAYLQADGEKANVSNFILGYVYEQGRIVTIRCKYASGHIADVELTSKVEKCLATRERTGALTVTCH